MRRLSHILAHLEASMGSTRTRVGTETKRKYDAAAALRTLQNSEGRFPPYQLDKMPVPLLACDAQRSHPFKHVLSKEEHVIFESGDHKAIKDMLSAKRYTVDKPATFFLSAFDMATVVSCILDPETGIPADRLAMTPHTGVVRTGIHYRVTAGSHKDLQRVRYGMVTFDDHGNVSKIEIKPLKEGEVISLIVDMPRPTDKLEITGHTPSLLDRFIQTCFPRGDVGDYAGIATAHCLKRSSVSSDKPTFTASDFCYQLERIRACGITSLHNYFNGQKKPISFFLSESKAFSEFLNVGSPSALAMKGIHLSHATTTLDELLDKEGNPIAKPATKKPMPTVEGGTSVSSASLPGVAIKPEAPKTEKKTVAESVKIGKKSQGSSEEDNEIVLFGVERKKALEKLPKQERMVIHHFTDLVNFMFSPSADKSRAVKAKDLQDRLKDINRVILSHDFLNEFQTALLSLLTILIKKEEPLFDPLNLDTTTLKMCHKAFLEVQGRIKKKLADFKSTAAIKARTKAKEEELLKNGTAGNAKDIAQKEINQQTKELAGQLTLLQGYIDPVITSLDAMVKRKERKQKTEEDMVKIKDEVELLNTLIEKLNKIKASTPGASAISLPSLIETRNAINAIAELFRTQFHQWVSNKPGKSVPSLSFLFEGRVPLDINRNTSMAKGLIASANKALSLILSIPSSLKNEQLEICKGYCSTVQEALSNLKESGLEKTSTVPAEQVLNEVLKISKEFFTNKLMVDLYEDMRTRVKEDTEASIMKEKMKSALEQILLANKYYEGILQTRSQMMFCHSLQHHQIRMRSAVKTPGATTTTETATASTATATATTTAATAIETHAIKRGPEGISPEAPKGKAEEIRELERQKLALEEQITKLQTELAKPSPSPVTTTASSSSKEPSSTSSASSSSKDSTSSTSSPKTIGKVFAGTAHGAFMWVFAEFAQLKAEIAEIEKKATKEELASGKLNPKLEDLMQRSKTMIALFQEHIGVFKGRRELDLHGLETAATCRDSYTAFASGMSDHIDTSILGCHA